VKLFEGRKATWQISNQPRTIHQGKLTEFRKFSHSTFIDTVRPQPLLPPQHISDV
jgi:hypothetical protein